jgi:hypothetical protein
MLKYNITGNFKFRRKNNGIQRPMAQTLLQMVHNWITQKNMKCNPAGYRDIG